MVWIDTGGVELLVKHQLRMFLLPSFVAWDFWLPKTRIAVCSVPGKCVRWDFRKYFLSGRVVKGLPRAVLGSPSLEMLGKSVDVAFHDVVF